MVSRTVHTSPAQVDMFLGRQGKETLNIPQIVVMTRQA